MNVTINGFEIGMGDVVLVPPLQGMAKPPIRTSSGNFSGRDGGWLSSQFYSPRQIVVNGLINGNSCDNAYELMCELQNMVTIRQLMPFIYTTTTGTSYLAEVYLIDMNMDITQDRIYEFQLTLLAPDPSFFIVDPDDPNEGWIEQTFTTIVGGGYVTPYVLPVEWSPSAQPTVINNPTDKIIYPQIIITGQYTNPQINNNSTGQFIKVNVTTAPGDVIIIDMANRTITLNGTSILATRTGNWWGLLPGETLVSLETDDPTDEQEGVIRYRPAYSGVFEGLC